MTDKLMPEIRTIAEVTKMGFVEKQKQMIRDAFTKDWYFCGWERWMVMACFLWSVWSIVKFVWSLF
jgi:hypothetical protein